MVQALTVINEVGDIVMAKYSRQPVPKYSEDDEDFRQRHANTIMHFAVERHLRLKAIVMH